MFKVFHHKYASDTIKATLKTTGLVLVGIPLSPLVFVSPTMGIVQLMTSE